MSSTVNRNPYRQTDPRIIALLGVLALALQAWFFWRSIPVLLRHNTVGSLLNAMGWGASMMFGIMFTMARMLDSQRESRRFRREQRWQAIEACDEFDAHATIVPLGDGFGVRVLSADSTSVVYTIDEARQKLRELRHLTVANSAGGAE